VGFNGSEIIKQRNFKKSAHSENFWSTVVDNEQLQKKQCWKQTRSFSLGSVWVLWKMSKTSTIENASQHNEEFKGIIHCRSFSHFLSEIFCSGFGWSLARRVSKSFDISELFL
jgi:hypothetical protein